MREHNDPKGWIALDTKQSTTCIVIHWTDTCATTCIGIDSPTLFVGLLVQKVGDSSPMDTLNVWTTHIRYTSTTHQMLKSKRTPTMHYTSIYIQRTNQNLSNTQNMRIRFIFDEPKLLFFFSATISALA